MPYFVAFSYLFSVTLALLLAKIAKDTKRLKERAEAAERCIIELAQSIEKHEHASTTLAAKTLEALRALNVKVEEAKDAVRDLPVEFEPEASIDAEAGAGGEPESP